MTRRVIGAMVVSAVVAAGCGRESAQEPAAPAPAEVTETNEEEANAIHLTEDAVRDLRISTAVVVERSGAGEVTVLGEVAVDQARYAEVTPPMGGQIVRIPAGLNDVVRAGASLVEIRSTELGRARADLLSAQARHDLARQVLDRKRGLAEERIVALREVQEAEATFRSAEADVRAASTSLQAFGVAPDIAAVGDGSVFVVRSPISGRVLERRAVLGQYADPTMPLFIVADLNRVWVVAQAFERDAVNVAPGTIAHVTLAALPGEELDGRVALVGRQVDPASRTLPVRIEVSNQAGVLRPGMSASIRLEVRGESRTILAVPADALQRVGDRWLAFVPTGQFEYEMRPVGRGRDLGTDVEVVSGLRAGETVVVEGAFLLKAEAEKRGGGGDEHGH